MTPPAEPSAFADEEAWSAWRLARARALPPWGFDAGWLTAMALDREHLPRVIVQCGVGRLLLALPRPLWWPRWGVLPLADEARRRHGIRDPRDWQDAPETVLAFDRKPDRQPGEPRPILYVDEALGEWTCPDLGRSGPELVSLCAWCWGLSRTKAAWRLGRVLGLRRPVPL